MPPSPSWISISQLPPPGPTVLSLLPSLKDPDNISVESLRGVPRLFIRGLRVRISVFVNEQGCSLYNEIDADDARSWHWIALDGEKPVATMRLVPVSTITKELNGKGQEKEVVTEKEHRDLLHDDKDKTSGGLLTEPYHGATKMWDGRQPYIKIGRMATLAEYRGKGIAQTLIDESLDWAKAHAAELSSGEGKQLGDAPQWNGLVLSHAQKSVQRWWGKMGFEVDEGLGVWWEEGIEHIGMWRRVEVLS
ncbi:MAG: hypothetical protein LQ337_004783 [Flavoplaca oasis]|nr:MAG: hypothetical protein LQ337_004783 [Flavoplaca oasis]